MFDRTRFSRLITLALASCAVTWAFAAGAFARPDANTGVAPSAEVAPNPAVAPPPVYKVVPGDTDKVPSASTAPAYQPAIGDSLKGARPRRRRPQPREPEPRRQGRPARRERRQRPHRHDRADHRHRRDARRARRRHVHRRPPQQGPVLRA